MNSTFMQKLYKKKKNNPANKETKTIPLPIPLVYENDKEVL